VKPGKIILLFSFFAVLVVAPAFAQNGNVMHAESRYLKGTAKFLTLPEPKQAPDAAEVAALASSTNHVPTWQSSFELFGATFPVVMIGTDPALGSATTTVPVELIPLKITFKDGSQLSAQQTACGDTATPIVRILASPLFNNMSYTLGGTVVGNTQYLDAFQRANFWNEVQKKSPDYHVLLAPSVAPVQSITANASDDIVAQGPCGLLAAMDVDELNQQVLSLINKLHISANTLPVFVTYNTFGDQGSACCILGFHQRTAAGRPYIVSSYSDPGLFTVASLTDIDALSHELGEWMDDPTTRNFIPAWGNVGQQLGCAFSLEVGDPLTGTAAEITMNGFTYHPQDLAFLPWFEHKQRSTSVNGWFSFQNSFTGSQHVCQP